MGGEDFDLGGEEGDEDFDLGGEEGGEDFGGEEDDDVLLAEPPAKRDLDEEGSYITPGAKGKRYTPAKRDKRKDAGPRSKNYKRATMPEISPRTFYPGKSGIGGLDSLAKGLFENKESNYEQRQILEEERLLETNYEIQKLIDGMESKGPENETQ